MSETKVDEVADLLRERIASNKYGEEGRLPSLRELAIQFGTSRETVNKAVQLLQSEGSLISKGRSIYVQAQQTRLSGGITARFDLALIEQGFTPVETDIEAPSLVPAPPAIAKVFGAKEDMELVRRYRRQGTDKVHYRLAENYYSSKLAGGDIFHQMQQDSRFDVLKAIKETHGKVIVPVHEEIQGRLPTSVEQRLLSIKRTTPILEMKRICYSSDGEVIMFSHIIFVASYFILSYEYETSHWTDEPRQ